MQPLYLALWKRHIPCEEEEPIPIGVAGEMHARIAIPDGVESALTLDFSGLTPLMMAEMVSGEGLLCST